MQAMFSGVAVVKSDGLGSGVDRGGLLLRSVVLMICVLATNCVLLVLMGVWCLLVLCVDLCCGLRKKLLL